AFRSQYAGVEGPSGALIALAEPLNRVARRYFAAVVRRTIVHNDDFNRLIALLQRALDRVTNQVRGVVTRDADAHERAIGSSCDLGVMHFLRPYGSRGVHRIDSPADHGPCQHCAVERNQECSMAQRNLAVYDATRQMSQTAAPCSRRKKVRM